MGVMDDYYYNQEIGYNPPYESTYEEPSSYYETQYQDLAPYQSSYDQPSGQLSYDDWAAQNISGSTPDAPGMYAAVSPLSYEDFARQYGGSWANGPDGTIGNGSYYGAADPFFGYSTLESINKGIGALSAFGNTNIGALSAFGNTNIGGLLGQLGSAGIAAYGANKQNKLTAKAQKDHDAAVAAAKAKADQYGAPLRLVNPRAATAPTARNGASEWFTNNAAPKYYAEGGIINDGGVGYGNNQGWTQYADGGLSRIRRYAEGNDRNIEAAERGDMGEPSSPAIPQARGSMTEAEKYALEAARLEAEQLAKAKARMLPKKTNIFGFAGGGLNQASPNYVRGGTTGQSDKVPAMLSDGEYVFDADSVAALGDGNNEAGAAKLDQMRQNIRAHKRSAPTHKIPPKAKTTQAYMKGAK